MVCHGSVQEEADASDLEHSGVGKRLRVFQLARFYRTLGMLLKGGTPIIAALGSVTGLLDADLQMK